MIAFVISNKEKSIYLDKLKGRIFKILPLFENSEVDYKLYVSSLLISLNSANELFDGMLIDIFVNIHSIYCNDFSHKEIKKIILETVPIVSKLKEGVDDCGEGNK